MCPPVVGIANSPEMAKKRTMFPLGGHRSAPTGELGRWEEVIRRVFSF